MRISSSTEATKIHMIMISESRSMPIHLTIATPCEGESRWSKSVFSISWDNNALRAFTVLAWAADFIIRSRIVMYVRVRRSF